MRLSINIRTAQGLKRTLSVDSEDTVEEILRRLYEDAWEQYRLIFGNDVLKDDRTLGSYNLRDGSTLFVVMKMPGGGPDPEDEDKGVSRTDSMEKLADMQKDESWCSIQ